jgi:hypothetical protein
MSFCKLPLKLAVETVESWPVKELIARPGGVAQWTSHLPQEQEDPGSNPARV